MSIDNSISNAVLKI